MIHRMGADRMTFCVSPAYQLRMQPRHPTHDKKGRRHAISSKNVEDPVRIRMCRSIVEREYDFLVGERQRLRITHRPYPRVTSRIDDDRARGSEARWVS